MVVILILLAAGLTISAAFKQKKSSARQTDFIESGQVIQNQQTQ
jgi:hypothetical protein